MKIWDDIDRFYWDQWFARNSATPHHRMRTDAWDKSQEKNAEALEFYLQRERMQRARIGLDAVYEWRNRLGMWEI